MSLPAAAGKQVFESRRALSFPWRVGASSPLLPLNELRELVKGGAVYEERRAPGKVGGASRIVNDFSDERRTPSRSGLPKWRATATESGTSATVRDTERDGSTTQGTDPGLGPSVAAGTLSDDFTETYVGHQTTVELPLAPVVAEAAAVPVAAVLPRAKDVASEVAAVAKAADASEAEEVAPKTKSEPPKGRVLRRENVEDAGVAPPALSLIGRMVTQPDGDKAEWAEKIASQVRSGAPGTPVVKPKEPEAATPVKEASSPKSGRDEPTLIREKDGLPEAPPVESRRVEKRTELRIGVGAGMLAMLIAGILIGRWFWFGGVAPRAGIGVGTTAMSVGSTAPPLLVTPTAPASAPSSAPSAVEPAAGTSTQVKPVQPKHSAGASTTQPKASVSPSVAVVVPAAPEPSHPPVALPTHGPAPVASIPFGSYMEEKKQ